MTYNRKCMSLRELAGRLRLPISTVREYAQAADDVSAIEIKEIPALLPKLLSQSHISFEVASLPEELERQEPALVSTLVSTYRNPATFPASISPTQGVQIREMILDAQPKRVVEIGCWLGISTLWISSALKKLGRGRLVSVDLFLPKLPEWPSCRGCVADPHLFVRQALAAAGLEGWVDLVQGESARFSRSYADSNQPAIDFLFIDGDHSIGGVMDDFVSFYPLLPIGGKILLHDINPEVCGWQGPRFLVDRLLTAPCDFEVDIVATQPNYGMALITKTSDNQRYHPGGDTEFDKIRKQRRFLKRLGYSPVYQNLIKPILFAARTFRSNSR